MYAQVIDDETGKTLASASTTEGDLAANLVRTEEVIDEAAEAGCDFVCLPELFLCGGKVEDQRRLAMSLDDERLAGLGTTKR